MNVVVVGQGSIGTRHARILGELGCAVSIVSRRGGEFPSVAAAIDAKKPGYVVVANETSQHRATLEEIAATGCEGAVLVEKPLFDAPAAIPANRFSLGCVGYNMRFHPLTRALREFAAADTLVAAQAYVGQYLPSWRPDTDYRDSYSASRARGGGVLRDLSHEIDTLRMLLGDTKSIAAIGGHFSSLEIDSDDVFALMMRSERCPVVTLQMNYVDRRTRREMLLVGERGTIHADYVAAAADVDRDYTYREMHRAVIEGRGDELASFEDGVAVVNLIAAAERAASQSEWVKP